MPAVTANSTYSAPSLTTIIQEIVNRAGWASGNALAIAVINTDPTSNDFHDWKTFDSGAANAAKLTIIY